jgi:hypothetical protein
MRSPVAWAEPLSVEQKREYDLVVLPVGHAPGPWLRRAVCITMSQTRSGVRGRIANRSVQDVDGGGAVLFDRFGDAVGDDDAEVARLDRQGCRLVGGVGE